MKPATKFILHIGRHKTGTSSLQEFLNSNQQALQNKGVLYPRAGRRSLAHHALAHALTTKQRRAHRANCEATINDYLSMLQSETAGWTGRILISSEAFQAALPELVSELFPPGDTTVVAYLREQAEYLISTYQQTVHAQRYHAPLSEMAKRPTLNYAQFIGRWEDCYPKRHLIVRPYSRDSLHNGDVVADFLQATHIRLAAPEQGSDQNPSIGGAMLELKRIVNRWFPSDDLPDRVYNVFSKASTQSPAFRHKPQLTEAEVTRIRAEAKDSNRLVSRRYMRGDETLLSAPKTPRTPPPLTATDFLDALQSVHALNDQMCGQIVLPSLGEACGLGRRELKEVSAALTDHQTPREGAAKLLADLLKSIQPSGHNQPWVWNFELAL